MITSVTHEFKNIPQNIKILLHYDEIDSYEDYYVVILPMSAKQYQFSNKDDIQKFLQKYKNSK